MGLKDAEMGQPEGVGLGQQTFQRERYGVAVH
jgi:hypothetical protein